MRHELTMESIGRAWQASQTSGARLTDTVEGDFELTLHISDMPMWVIVHTHPDGTESVEIGHYWARSIDTESVPLKKARDIFDSLVQEMSQHNNNNNNNKTLSQVWADYKRRQEIAEAEREQYYDKTTLEKVDGTSLFYPCSANDLLVPIRLFAPYVTSFWFVDKGYFVPGHYITNESGLDQPASKHTPLLADEPDYMFIGSTIHGQDRGSREEVHITPTLLVETYLHIPTDKTITVVKRRGYGFSALKKHKKPLGVFFYRGDSGGEGGSGNMWLSKREHVRSVIEKLVDNGLMVLDGSDGTRYRRGSFKEYSSFWKYRDMPMSAPKDALTVCKPFTDYVGNQFTCMGHAGQRYGHTLMWQLKKNNGTG